MLGQRLDRRQGLQGLGAHPVIGELLGMEACPRADEPQRTRRKRPVENAQSGKLDLSDLIAVLSVEVGRRMIGAVHPYDDSVERGQARHRAIVGDGAADTPGSAPIPGLTYLTSNSPAAPPVGARGGAAAGVRSKPSSR
jgi:hypothetical protein